MVINTEKKYLSSKEAGARLGYTHDYISRLCRQGKMEGVQKGREWFVTAEELELFKARHEIELAEKKKELSKKFSKIRKEAEARKRAARALVKVEAQKNQAPLSKSTDEEVVKPTQSRLSFAVPKQVVALVVLGLIVFGQNILISSQDIPTKNVASSFASTSSLSEITQIIDEGINDVIYTQAEVAEPVVSSIVEELDLKGLLDGAVAAPLHFVTFLNSVGNGYLTLYTLQGEIIYTSILDLNTMGATVLRGYELMGESFLVGSTDIVQRYQNIFNLEQKTEALLQYPRAYIANVSGGFEYITQETNITLVSKIKALSAAILFSTQNNVKYNMASVGQTVEGLSLKTYTYVNSIFEFDLQKKEKRVRSIRLND